MEQADLTELQRILRIVFPSADASEVADALGCTSLSCFEDVDARDIVADTSLKAVPARRLLRMVNDVLRSQRDSRELQTAAVTPQNSDVNALVSAVPSCSPSSCTITGKAASLAPSLQPPDRGSSLHRAHARANSTSEQLQPPLEVTSDSEKDSSSASAREPLPEGDSDYVLDVSGSEASSYEAEIQARGRKRKRKRIRDGSKHGVSREQRLLAGAGQAVVPEPRARMHARASALSVGASGCVCEQRLESLRARFNTARRSTLEMRAFPERGKVPFNYATLMPIAIEVLFDGNGNWLYHSQCIRKFFGFSSNWSASVHAAAIALYKSPTVKIRKKDLGKDTERIMLRLIVPEICTETPMKYLQGLDKDDEVELVAERKNLHGLVGMPSNNSKQKAREFLIHFVQNNSAPNGRTPDTHGRCHGARLYLDARFLVYRSQKDSDTRLSFATEVVREMNAIEPFLSNPKLRIIPHTAYRMFREEFGIRRVVHGVSEHNPNYTTLYPHKSDACADCFRYREQMNSDRQTLKRHTQQTDRTIPRMNEINRLKTAIEDHKVGLANHVDMASRASAFHKECINTAYDNYDSACSLWNELKQKGREATSQDVTHFVDRLYPSEGPGLWFDLSTDYQQDKLVPSWRQSPQPGPTYYLSGISHYVHLMCFESCGKADGPSRFSRNLVYVRDERIAGSKTSDDTLSTIADALLGRSEPSVKQPKVYRTGYDSDGQIL